MMDLQESFSSPHRFFWFFSYQVDNIFAFSSFESFDFLVSFLLLAIKIWGQWEHSVLGISSIPSTRVGREITWEKAFH